MGQSDKHHKWKKDLETLCDLILNLTSFASLSRSDFLSQDLKVSKVLVLYRVPKAGQQRAGMEAFLKKQEGKLWEVTQSAAAA